MSIYTIDTPNHLRDSGSALDNDQRTAYLVATNRERPYWEAKAEDMRTWTIAEAEKLFEELNEDDSPTKRGVEMDRPNSSEPFSGSDFVEKFENGLQDQLDMAEAVFKAVGA